MSKWRKKPVEIEAFQMTLVRRWDNSEWPVWLGKAWNTEGVGSFRPDPDAPNAHGQGSADKLVIGTLEGVLHVDWDDWIIKGVEGEIYPCKPGIFKACYEPVEKAGAA